MLFYIKKANKQLKMSKIKDPNNILEYLMKDSRTPISVIARKLGMPTSTVYDHYKKLRERFWFTVVKIDDTDTLSTELVHKTLLSRQTPKP